MDAAKCDKWMGQTWTPANWRNAGILVGAAAGYAWYEFGGGKYNKMML